MKTIESREHELQSFNAVEAANESPFEPEQAAALVQATCAGSAAIGAAPAPGGWSPYEVWRTRVSRLAPSGDPRPRH